MLEQELITSFDTVKELDEFIASALIEELQKPGLILLPVGNTFEASTEQSPGIYPLVNDYFAAKENRLYSPEQELYKEEHHQVNPELKLSHLDELVDSKTSFATRLQEQLSNVVEQCDERFYKIDTNDIPAFEKFLRMARGPRVIVLGLGANPDAAHVAFMGEDYINSSIEEINLSDELAVVHGTSRAVTIGSDIFRSPALERIILVVKGKSKAKSLAAGFENADTGVGYLVKNHSDKLCIFTDQEALFDLKN